MLGLKKIKGGKVAYIFDKEYADIAVRMFPAISSKVIGSHGASLTLDVGASEETAEDVLTRVKGTEVRKLRLNTPRTTYGIPATLDEQRAHIRELVIELCNKDGLRVGTAWNKAYRLLYDATGFDAKLNQVLDRGKPSGIVTVLNRGKGSDLIRVLRSYLGK